MNRRISRTRPEIRTNAALSRIQDTGKKRNSIFMIRIITVSAK